MTQVIQSPMEGGMTARPLGAGSFVCENEAYALLGRSGFAPPRHALVGEPMPFNDGEAVVLKGMGEGLLHKSEIGAVGFLDFDLEELVREGVAMRANVQGAGYRWKGALVCERIDAANSGGFPAELLVSISRSEAGWIAVIGLGGLGVEAFAEQVKPLCWPVDSVSPAEALLELEAHFIGKILLGAQRGSKAVTTKPQLGGMIESLWRLAAIAEAAGLSELEMNPVIFDRHGNARPLDAVGVGALRTPGRIGPPPDFLEVLLNPLSVAVAGVSARPGGVGHTILENLRFCPALRGRITLVKTGREQLFGFPCVTDVSALKESPVDLLLLATPAPASIEILAQLIEQGGGARVVGVIAGGIGDGADSGGYGKELAALISIARSAGRWTPAVLGPNFMGHWAPGRSLDTTFIPRAKLPRPSEKRGSLALLSQSGAFLLCRRSQHPDLKLFLGVALGNQIDLSLPDCLEALAPIDECRAVAAYVEGFSPGQLGATVSAARKLRDRNVRILMHRAGRSVAGRKAASSHTGAIAGDLVVERAVLERAGVRFSESVAAFDAALTWLAAYPGIEIGPLALVSNAGFECVTGSDAFERTDLGFSVLKLAEVGAETRGQLERMIEAEGMGGIVNPALPLDLTPMAGESAYLRAAEILLRGECKILIMGLVPFSPRLKTGESARSFACAVGALARASGKPIGIVVDAGGTYRAFKDLFIEEELPVFARLEDAILGIKTLA